MSLLLYRALNISTHRCTSNIQYGRVFKSWISDNNRRFGHSQDYQPRKRERLPLKEHNKSRGIRDEDNEIGEFDEEDKEDKERRSIRQRNMPKRHFEAKKSNMEHWIQEWKKFLYSDASSKEEKEIDVDLLEKREESKGLHCI